MTGFTDHPERRILNDEVHARPPAEIQAPADISYLALLHGDLTLEDDYRTLCDLIRRSGGTTPEPGHDHYLKTLFVSDEHYPGGIRVKWERHSEFTSYTFLGAGREDEGFEITPLSRIVDEWVASLEGARIAAIHMTVREGAIDDVDPNAISARWFKGNPPIGAQIADGGGSAYSDYRIHPDGFSRVVVVQHDMNPRQCGRMVQRLIELDTYRMLALLALPIAKSLTPFLDTCERELASVTSDMSHGAAAEGRDDRALLDRLVDLEADVQGRELTSHYRFSAAAAYYELVRQRTAELRQNRVQGFQNFAEFIDRRLAPAMRTCRAVSARQHALADRTARVTQLLSTRVSVTLERQNQELLQSMNARTTQQLRLQETVEGLSVAAVTYYLVGLVAYLAKGLAQMGLIGSPVLVTSLSVPVVLVFVALGLKRVKRRIGSDAV